MQRASGETKWVSCTYVMEMDGSILFYIHMGGKYVMRREGDEME